LRLAGAAVHQHNLLDARKSHLAWACQEHYRHRGRQKFCDAPATAARARVCLQVFSPKNPTGHYTLALASQLHFMTAARLLALYRQQAARGLCRWPLRYCFAECTLDGAELDVSDPHKLTLPAGSGVLSVSFVDLAPTPADVVAMHPSTFAALRSLLLNAPVCARTCCNSFWFGVAGRNPS
jgi:hypothetical protein